MNSKTVILGISGGIAAVKTPELKKLLEKQGFRVKVVLTKAAKYFVKLNGHSDLFPVGFNPQQVLQQRQVEHIALADKAGLVLIAPATANIIAKLAHGLADDYLTTLVLATKAPIIICPAMNVNMWQNPAVQANLRILIDRGVEIIYPAAGILACGYKGLGRLEELNKIVKQVVKRIILEDRLKYKKILVTAGPTREPIDAVRFITNSSSGKMGRALADEAIKRGATVKLLLGQRDFVTGADLLAQIKRLTPGFDIIFHTAAVGDFSVRQIAGKLSSRKSAKLTLEKQVKILNQIKRFNPKIFVVGFKAGYGLPKKLTVQPSVDCTIYNDVSRSDIGFGSDSNEVVAVLPDKQIKFKKDSKAVIAGKILDFLGRYYHW